MKQEEAVHKAVCRYLKMQYPNVIFFSEPSGLRVTIGIRNLLKSLRSCASLPDLFIMEPKNDFHGLIIEIKSGPEVLYKRNGELSGEQHVQDQKKILDLFSEKGYRAVFGAGFDACKKIIDDYLVGREPITPKHLEKVVCKYYGIEPELLHSKSQKREIVEPRQMIMALIHTLHGKSNRNSGIHFLKDHATVTHSRKTIQGLYDTDRSFRERAHRILSDLGVQEITFYQN